LAETPKTSRHILNTRIDATTYEGATERVVDWAQNRESRYVCVTSVHGVIEAKENTQFRAVWNESDLNTPDGMPLVWGLRMLGVSKASRVYGPTLTLHVCQAAAARGVSVGLYGGTPESLQEFSGFLRRRFPSINISCAIAPPFRPLTQEEDARYTREIEESDTQILLVGIGCPKQEKWMHAHQDKVKAVMIGVGAAFDFHAGRVRQAPTWIRKSGLEWLFRLSMEPRRLWRRYARIVPRFISAFGRQLLRHHFTGQPARHSEADAPLPNP